MNISVGGVIEIQTAITKDCQYSCGSEIYCACSSIIHKGTPKICSIKHSRDMTNQIIPLRVE